MPLAAFILANIEPIAREWEEFAKTCTPASIGMTRSGLLDDVTRILRAVVDDMEQPQTSTEQEAKGKSLRSSGLLGRVAASHVGLRIESRFDLAQIVSEYRAMRASVLRLWSDSRPGGLSEDAMSLIRFDEAIDQSVAEIVPTYLQRESQYRDRFFGMLGHDLRTPINAIELSASALSMEEQLSEDGAKCVSRILNSSQRLDRMVRDILDFTRGRFGEPMYVNRTQTDLGVILRGIVDEIQCANPDILLDVATSGDLGGEWDGERLSQLISNLVTNAIQHGRTHQVSVRTQEENAWILIEVHNDGLPIPQASIATIFNPLGREKRSDHSQAGLGLGLFICQEIVKAHHGTINVTSSQDAGTTFTVRLNRRAGVHQEDTNLSA
ncbi:MAG TPA: HAMP domain-containing sensor histidine kinase [Chloroflexota bacterium]|nr:HAMP domain-containing sensor histidine kinase [Chloroflexota bacterium]